MVTIKPKFSTTADRRDTNKSGSSMGKFFPYRMLTGSRAAPQKSAKKIASNRPCSAHFAMLSQYSICVQSCSRGSKANPRSGSYWKKGQICNDFLFFIVVLLLSEKLQAKRSVVEFTHVSLNSLISIRWGR